MNGTTLLTVPFLAGLGCVLGSLAPAQIVSGSPQASKASVDPTFEVATIRPSNPNDVEWGLGTRGNHFWAQNTTVIDLISFAYELHAKQIAGGPSWCRTEKFDVEGVPNFEGRPLRVQLQTMLRKLLADRFQLQVHTEKQQLAVYVLAVTSGGVKFRKSDAPPDARSFYGFPDIVPVTQMKVMRMTMPAFASALQRTVLDRPVVDETGLPDRYDFVLQWTPDESQFIQFRGTGVIVPSNGGDANAPPGLFTAIQNQLGLKLEAKKAMDNVMVIDHVEHPSPN
ncbi:MAG: TIGR03435 family protein [Terracidiphilus sp.]